MCFGGGGKKGKVTPNPVARGPMADPNSGSRKPTIRPGLTDIAVPKIKTQTLLGSPLVSGRGSGGKTLLGQ